MNITSNILSKVVFCIMLASTALCSADSVPLSEEAKTLKKGIYQHYKGPLYEVVAIAHHSETLEEYVTYRHLYGDYSYWIRPIGMFCETVINADNQEVPRFKFIGEPGNFDKEVEYNLKDIISH